MKKRSSLKYLGLLSIIGAAAFILVRLYFKETRDSLEFIPMTFFFFGIALIEIDSRISRLENKVLKNGE